MNLVKLKILFIDPHHRFKYFIQIQHVRPIHTLKVIMDSNKHKRYHDLVILFKIWFES